MLAPSMQLMNKYRPLLVKLHQDAIVKKPKKIATKAYSGLTDVKIVVGLACLLPMLKVTNALMKAAQHNEVFVCDYLVRVKTLQNDLADMYVEPRIRFTHGPFWDFIALKEACHDVIPMCWIPNSSGLDLNASGIEYLCFQPKEGQLILATYRDPLIRDNIPVSRDVYAVIISQGELPGLSRGR
jgi:hypothetical protein